jgi:hypothetical protein
MFSQASILEALRQTDMRAGFVLSTELNTGACISQLPVSCERFASTPNSFSTQEAGSTCLSEADMKTERKSPYGLPVYKRLSPSGYWILYWHIPGTAVTPHGIGRAMESRVIWEERNGIIPPNHVLHHINEDRADNRLDNLALMSRQAHSMLHNGGKPHTRKYKDGPLPHDEYAKWKQERDKVEKARVS